MSMMRISVNSLYKCTSIMCYDDVVAFDLFACCSVCTERSTACSRNADSNCFRTNISAFSALPISCMKISVVFNAVGDAILFYFIFSMPLNNFITVIWNHEWHTHTKMEKKNIPKIHESNIFAFILKFSFDKKNSNKRIDARRVCVCFALVGWFYACKTYLHAVQPR